MKSQIRWVIMLPLSALLAAGCSTDPGLDRDAPVTHPFLLFSRDETAALAARRTADPLLTGCWQRLADQAAAADEPGSWSQLEARALLWQVARDEPMGRRAVALLRATLVQVNAADFYAKANLLEFDVQAEPLRALALAWDWLHDRMTPEERGEVLPRLEEWCRAAFEHTEKQWWREASYNVGAIPVAGYGLLALSIRGDCPLFRAVSKKGTVPLVGRNEGDSPSPTVRQCFREAARRIGQNYFPTAWRESGICYEGPNYAIVGLKYPAVFAEALRRAGGEDLLGRSGALRAMGYLMHQWMPQGGCAPIGDNTGYGGRTFAAEYLLGLGRTRDAAGLWTWRQFTNQRRLDPLVAFLWYPLGIEPRSPGAAGLPTSACFEVTPNRAGYLFARSRWDDPKAAFFAFVTRYEKCNHQHYDMNSFLLGANGTLFATHRLLYPYGHENHGVDYEHNLVIVDGGGWPARDRTNTCAEQNSTDGVLTGLALGPLADYVRGDAKFSYRDNTVPGSNPAIRAERACLFVKAPPTPYLLIFDDQQFSQDEHDYAWLWHAPDLPAAGKGTPADPLVLTGPGGSCAIHFVAPADPELTVKAAEGEVREGKTGIQRISVAQRGVRVQYAAVATLQATGAARPTLRTLDVAADRDRSTRSTPQSAGAVRIELPDGSVDCVVWQSEEDRVQAGAPLTVPGSAEGRTGAKSLRTDGLVAMVRERDGRVVGYVLGEGTYLAWGETMLVRSPAVADGPAEPVCVTASPEGVELFGRRRAREGLPPLPATGVQAARLPAGGR